MAAYHGVALLDLVREVQKYENIENEYLVTTKFDSDPFFTVHG